MTDDDNKKVTRSAPLPMSEIQRGKAAGWDLISIEKENSNQWTYTFKKKDQ